MQTSCICKKFELQNKLETDCNRSNKNISITDRVSSLLVGRQLRSYSNLYLLNKKGSEFEDKSPWIISRGQVSVGNLLFFTLIIFDPKGLSLQWDDKEKQNTHMFVFCFW